MATSQLNSTGASLVQALMRAMAMTAPTTVAGSTDKRTTQFWQLATDAGQQLSMEGHNWQFLSREFTITTVPGTAEYDLPSDFDGFIADSQWNRTTRLPVIGSLEEYEWQMLKARLLAGTAFTTLFRVQNDQVVFYDTPTSVQTIVMPYTGRGWVRDAVDPLVYKDNLEVDGDIVLYDPQLFKVALKRAWYESKQFDTSKLMVEYNKVLASVMGTDTTARTLSLSGGSDYPYLGVLNLPDTGYGS
jgi:hypothetical protein